MLLENAKNLRENALKRIEDDYSLDIQRVGNALSKAANEGSFECYTDDFPTPVKSYLIELGYKVSLAVVNGKLALKVSFDTCNDLNELNSKLERMTSIMSDIPENINRANKFNTQELYDLIMEYLT